MKAVVTVMIGNYIHRVTVIEGSLFTREYGINYNNVSTLKVLGINPTVFCFDSHSHFVLQFTQFTLSRVVLQHS